MHILLIDDHALFRSGMSAALTALGEDIAMSEAGSIDAASTIIESSHKNIDLVLLDYELPDGDGIGLLKHITRQYPDMPVAMLSAFEDTKLMKLALEAGALGYIPKRTSTSVILSAIQLILSGGTYIPPKLLPSMNIFNNRTTSQAEQGSEHFTQRQQEVLKLIINGLANKEIAWQLNISESTVKVHVSAILKIKGMHSRKQLIASAA
ncbi:DNA-binding response regulator [Mariprofundus sp. EBB-1]|uniref:response regulator n=1 Tax=Mariprofundus sp. EBB-1 TaxID=2650971 RepID=UPI000EF237F8|nr:response regulator transcription factor [Mariprofundus sp. EBB-1]RLL53534.1 DNA-binding response regulator [Mariprofundus sp. EBB-1]